MKNFLLVIVFAGFLFMLAGCSSAKYSQRSMHHRGVDNRGFRGY